MPWNFCSLKVSARKKNVESHISSHVFQPHLTTTCGWAAWQGHLTARDVEAWTLSHLLLFADFFGWELQAAVDRMFTANQPEQEDAASSGWRFLHSCRRKAFFPSDWTLTLFWLTIHWHSFVTDWSWKQLKGELNVYSAYLHSPLLLGK